MKKIIFLLFFIPLYAIAQENVRVDLSNPNATIYTHLYFLQDDTYQPKKAAKVFHGLTLTIAVDKAIKLKKILDGKGLFVDFSKIPSDPNFNDTIGYTSVYKYTLFPQRMPEIYVEKINGKWYYSPETIAQIDVIYNKVFPLYVDKLQKIIPDLGNKKAFGFELWQFIGILLMIVISILIVIIVKKFSYWILQAIQEKITHEDSNK